MRRTISSRWTYFNRFALPVWWVVMSIVWMTDVQMNALVGNLRGDWILWSSWLVIFALILCWCLPVKKVAIDGANLYLLGLFSETSIPLEDIDKVTDFVLLGGHRVTIHFKSSSKFGRRVWFIPKTPSHPIVDELEDLIASHRQREIVAEYKAMHPRRTA